MVIKETHVKKPGVDVRGLLQDDDVAPRALGRGDLRGKHQVSNMLGITRSFHLPATRHVLIKQLSIPC